MTGVQTCALPIYERSKLYFEFLRIKNKVKPKPFERIFWTKGLGEYVGVDDEYIALPKIGPDIIEFARKSKVRVISQNELSNYKDKQTRFP